MYLKMCKLTKDDIDIKVNIDKNTCNNCINVWLGSTDDYLALTIKEAESLHAQLGFALQECDGTIAQKR